MSGRPKSSCHATVFFRLGSMLVVNMETDGRIYLIFAHMHVWIRVGENTNNIQIITNSCSYDWGWVLPEKNVPRYYHDNSKHEMRYVPQYTTTLLEHHKQASDVHTEERTVHIFDSYF